ncbi:MAG: amidohydrolase [Gemmatimonadota bacterium]|nr:amidohydrolase [Gemmatimonadota bacterium]
MRQMPAVLCLAMLAGCATSEPADLVFQNGVVYTADEAMPNAEAVAIKDGMVLFVGTNASAARYIGDATEVIDLAGATVLPGLVDAHVHLTGIGQREMNLNLEGLNSLEAFLAKVKERIDQTAAGEWVVGRGWIETFWSPAVFPTRQDLDRIAPAHPVVLTRADGHASIANSMALRLAGVTRATRAPSGGAINIDAGGEPTGMLIDAAQGLVRRLVPATTDADLDRAVELGADREVRLGWVQVHDAHGSLAEVDRMRRLYGEERIKLRIYKAISGPSADADSLIQLGPSIDEFNGRFTVRTIKAVMDGALGSRGAALLQPYSDDPTTSGLITTDTTRLAPMLVAALRAGIQVETHAIGDRGNRLLLDMYQAAMTAVPAAERPTPDPRWRNEHAQIVDPADLPRFKELGIIASMQPSHAIGDLHFVPARIGLDRVAGAYAWQTLMSQGVPVAGGSDAPVERGEPMIEFYAAVARKDVRGFSGEGWHPEQALTRAQALRMFTYWPAFAAFEEDRRGMITAGKWADLTILDKDIMQVPEPEILTAKTLFTVINGEIAFRVTP